MMFKVWVLANLVSYSVLLGLSHVSMLLNFVWFSSINLSHINLILDQPEELGTERFCFSLTKCIDYQSSIIQLVRWASQVALVVKNLPANEADVRDVGLIPGWKDPLEEVMATHSSSLAWRIPWTEEPVGYSPVHRVTKGGTQLKRLSILTQW